MNLSAVMDELAGKFSALLTTTRVYAFPPDAVAPPAIIVGYPEQIDFDVSASRGVDRLTIPVHVLVDRNWDRATTEKLSGYLAGAGSSSVKQLVQTRPHTAFSTARIRSVSLNVISVAANEYWAATCLVDITGPGGA